MLSPYIYINLHYKSYFKDEETEAQGEPSATQVKVVKLRSEF